ncbi:MAG TPA: galactokinase [Rhodobacteraceae bacterium]|nr:galactokinase [Paracoccaceae bacterium]
MHTSTETDLNRTASQGFEARFGRVPAVVAFAPGRVNLMGEHTDYNGGYVLPMPLGLGVSVALGPGDSPGDIRFASAAFEAEETRRVDEAATGAWSDYVLGALKALVTSEITEAGLCVFVASNLPMGAGLSSSAAIEIGTLRAAAAMFSKPADPVDFALKARAVENDFVGMPCGIMDQFAVSVGAPGNALFLDTRTLEYHPAPLPEGYSFLVIHSGVSHQLTDSGYATRVAECKAACTALGVEMLSDLDDDDLPRIDAIAEPLNRRARHIVTDNRLTRDGLAVLEAGDAVAFGRLMVGSHATERDNYQITVPETDALVAAAVADGALGARQTGGGFGGAIVVLVADEAVDGFSARLAAAFPATRLLAVT